MRKFNLLKAMLLLCALIAGSGSEAWAADVYERVTSTSQLVAGDNYLLVCESKNAAMGAVGSYGESVAVTITSNTITVSDKLNVVTLGGSAGGWTFYSSKESKYLSWSSGNSLAVSETASANSAKWAISFSENNASITNVGTTSRKLQYNASSPRFACYTTSQTAIQIYKKQAVPVSSISLNKPSLSLAVGEEETLSVTVLPSSATDKTITWSSNNSNIASVNSAGKVTANAIGGPVTITATANDGSGKTATCEVTVIAARVNVTGVTLNKSATTLYVGDSETLTATVAPADATNKTVSWTSDDESVATVEDGEITAVGVGSATITATTEDGDFTATCDVTVNPVAVTSVALNKTSTSITYGNTETLTATILPANATNKNIVWTSSNESVATVEDGVITANAVGTTTITATSQADGTKADACTVTVTADKSKPKLTVTVFKETFSSVPETSNTALKASHFDNEGWSFNSYCYGFGGFSIRLASSNNAGNATTPALNLTGEGTLTLKAFGYKAGETTMSLSGTNCTLSTTSFTDLPVGENEEDLVEKTVGITVTGENPKITFNATANKRFILGEVKITQPGTTVDVTLNGSGFASYCSPFALDLTPTADYAAYAVKAVGGNTVMFTKIAGKVAANTPFVLYNEENADETVGLPIVDDDDTGIAAVSDNQLKGTISPTYVEAPAGYTCFGLSGSKFVKMTTGVVKANKAYLPVSNTVLEGAGSHEFSIIFDDEAAGIVAALKDNGEITNDRPIYNLAGQRVSKPTKGLYIVGGKKVVLR